MKNPLTHKFIIYSNGWKFKWEKKSDDEIKSDIIESAISLFVFIFLFLVLLPYE